MLHTHFNRKVLKGHCKLLARSLWKGDRRLAKIWKVMYVLQLNFVNTIYGIVHFCQIKGLL